MLNENSDGNEVSKVLIVGKDNEAMEKLVELQEKMIDVLNEKGGSDGDNPPK